MSKTIFITLLSLAAVALCDGGQTGHKLSCFNEAFTPKGNSLGVSFKYDSCNAKDFKFLTIQASKITDSYMTKKNPNAFGDKVYTDILKGLNRDNCYVSRTNNKNFHIVFSRTEDTQSYLPLIFKAGKNSAEFSLDIAATVEATEKIFYVRYTAQGPVKVSAKTEEVINDEFCRPQPETVDIDESVETDSESDLNEESGSVIPTNLDEHKTLDEINAEAMAKFQEEHLQQQELERLAEAHQAKLDQEAAAKQELVDQEDEEIYRRAMAHIAEADQHKNSLTGRDGRRIIGRLVDEDEQRAISKELADREAELKRIEAEERAAELRIISNKAKAQKQREDHKNKMQTLKDEKNAKQAENYAQMKEDQWIGRVGKQAGQNIDALLNRQDYADKYMANRSKKLYQRFGQYMTNAENRNEKEALLARKHAQDDKYAQINSFKRDKIKLGHDIKMAQLRKDRRAKFAEFRNQRFADKMQKLQKQDEQSKLAADRHAQYMEKYNAKQHDREVQKLSAKYNAQVTEQKVAELRAKHAARRQQLRQMIEEGRKEMNAQGNPTFIETTVAPRRVEVPTVTPTVAPTNTNDNNAVAPTNTNGNNAATPASASTVPSYGASMDDNFEENLDDGFFAFNDSETPANGMMGGWGNWHTCTEEEKDITRNYFAMMFAQLRIHNIAVYAQNMMQCKQQVVAGKNYEVKLAFNELECNVKFHFDLQGIIHDISGKVSQDAKSCVALYAYPFNAEATA